MPPVKDPEQDRLSRARNQGQSDYEHKMVDPFEKNKKSSTADSHEFSLVHDDEKNSIDDEYRKQEENPDNPSARKDEDIDTQENRAPWKNDVSAQPDQPKQSLAHRLKRKRNAIAVTIALMGATAGLITFIGGTAGIIVHFKEVVMSKVGDRSQSRQQARVSRIIAKQMSEDPLVKGCGVVKVKCRYKGMTNRQIEKFKKRNPGVQIRTEGKNSFGRYKIASIAFTDDNGRYRYITAKDSVKTSKQSSAFQQIKYKYNKSRVAHWWDQRSGNLLDKLGISKAIHRSNKPPPETSEEARKQAKAEDDAKKARAAQIRTDTEQKIKKSNVFGVLCAVKEIISSSGKIAKVQMMAKVVILAGLIYNVADTIKSGNATGDSGVNNQIALIATMLTSADSNGQTASDSFAFQYASRGILTNDKKYKKYQLGASSDQGVIGQVTRGASKQPGLEPLVSLSSVMLNQTLCNIAGGPVGTTLACAATIAAAVVSLGVGTGLAVVGCLATQIAVSKVVGVALPILLGQVVKTATTDGIKGGEAGNAFVGGASALASLNGRYHGEQPLTKTQVKEYDKFSDNAQGDGNWENTSSAFDIHNPKSFAGKLAAVFLPSAMQLSASPSNIPTTLANLPALSLSSFAGTAQAKTTIDGEYDQCDDADYEAIGVATDPFCVPQYGLDPSASLGDVEYNKPLATSKQDSTKQGGFNVAWLFQPQTAHAASDDTRGVAPDNRFDASLILKYMCGRELNNDEPCDKWIDSNGEPIAYENMDDDYADYIEKCLQTVEPIGSDSPEMCKPKQTKCSDAPSGSDFFRYCMYSHFDEDDGLIDQVEDNDAGGGAVDTTGENEESNTGSSEAFDGTGQEAAKVLLKEDSGVVIGDDRNLVQQMADGDDSPLDEEIVKVLAALSKNHDFSISSFYRGPCTASHHCEGRAVDINPTIDGQAISYSRHNAKIQTFINEAAVLLGTTCENGVPNQEYVTKTTSNGSKCQVFIDIGSGPHVHLATGS